LFLDLHFRFSHGLQLPLSSKKRRSTKLWDEALIEHALLPSFLSLFYLSVAETGDPQPPQLVDGLLDLECRSGTGTGTSTFAVRIALSPTPST